MRREPFTVGSYVHVFNRGNRKLPIVRNKADNWRFLRSLYYFNDEYAPDDLFRTLKEYSTIHPFERPKQWPVQKPLVEIIAYCLMKNHYHLLLREIRDGGVAKFMQKFGTGYTNYFNTRYKEVGSLFQGGYKIRVVEDTEYIKHLSVYIQVKNPFELYNGGFERAVNEFDKAYNFAIQYQFCSLADYAIKRRSSLIQDNIIFDIFSTPVEYKSFAREVIASDGLELREALADFV